MKKWAAILWIFFFSSHVSLLADNKEVTIDRKAASIHIKWNKGLNIQLVLQKDWILGVGEVSMNQVKLRSSSHLVLPLLSEEWSKNRKLLSFYKLKEIKTEGAKVEVIADIYGTESKEAFQHFFVYAPEKDTLILNRDPEYKAISLQLVNVGKEVEDLVSNQNLLLRNTRLHIQQLIKNLPLLSDFRSKETALQSIKLNSDSVKIWIKQYIESHRGHLPTLDILLEKQKTLQNRLVDLEWKHADILRDGHRFAATEVPSIACQKESLEALNLKLENSLKKYGEISFFFEYGTPVSIPGYATQSWKKWYNFTLDSNLKVNVIRELGTWELGGNLAGLKVINVRYRGMGRLDNQFKAEVSSIDFSTSDLWPAQYQKNPEILLKPAYAKWPGRKETLVKRNGANLVIAPKGAASGFFEFQAKENHAIISTNIKQGNFRSLSECYVGETVLSQSEEEWFPLSNSYTTEPKYFIFISQADLGIREDLYRTAWTKADDYLRAVVGQELNFKDVKIVPSVGMNWDIHKTGISFGKCAENLGLMASQLANEGVKLAVSHTSGWINGQTVKNGYDHQDTSNYLGNGSCNIYDWKPVPDLEKTWPNMYKSLKSNGIAYVPWLTSMTKAGSSFTSKIGLEPQKWALNSPDGRPNDTYGVDMLKHNALSSEFMSHYHKTLFEAKDKFGFDGFWLDSWHNLWMSELSWGDHTGAPMQRAWWEDMAMWSGKDCYIISESISFPGINCSIEVDHLYDDFWCLKNTFSWLRNGDHKKYSKDQLNIMGFKLMSVGGWLSFDILEYGTDGPYVLPSTIMPDFPLLASIKNKYMEGMVFEKYLQGMKGVVWSNASTGKSLVFGFQNSLQFSAQGIELLFDSKTGDKIYLMNTNRLDVVLKK